MAEQMYAQALNLIDTLAQKQHIKGLAEFEYLLYQKLCDAMAVYFGGLKFAFQKSAMETEMATQAEEIKYLAWLAELEAQRIKDEQTARKVEEEVRKIEEENEKKPPEEPLAGV